MLKNKYQSSRPCALGEKDFWRFLIFSYWVYIKYIHFTYRTMRKKIPGCCYLLVGVIGRPQNQQCSRLKLRAILCFFSTSKSRLCGGTRNPFFPLKCCCSLAWSMCAFTKTDKSQSPHIESDVWHSMW